MLHPSESAAVPLRDMAFHAFDDYPIPVYTTDPEGTLTYFNSACVEFAGHIPEIGASKWCVSWRLASEEGSSLEHDACPMAIAVKEQRSVRGVTAFAIRPDGTQRKFMPFPTPLFDEKRRFVGAINMLTPEDDLPQAEAIWSEVQAKLYQRSLHRSNDAAMAMISHELRQPLAAAENYLTAAKQLIKRPEAISQTAHAIDRASTVLRRLSNTLDGMRTTISKGVLARRRHSLQTILQSAVALSSTFLPVRPAMQLDNADIFVRVSGLQIEQVIMNLLKNAAEASMHQDHPEIVVSAFFKDAHFVQVEITDNGCGFALDCGGTVANAKSTKEEGEGIGLSLAQSIIAHHGGHLWIRRTSPNGTTMSFTLPLSKAGEVDDPDKHDRTRLRRFEI